MFQIKTGYSFFRQKLEVNINNSSLTVEEIVEKMKKENIEFVRFEIPDIHGLPRGKIIPIKHFSSFASNSINCVFAPMTPQGDTVPDFSKFKDHGCPDSFVKPDLSTYVKLPFVENTARFICDIIGGPMKELDCRELLRNQLNRLEKNGYSLYSGFEMEFMILDENKKPVFPGINYMNTLRNNFDQKFVYKILRTLNEMDIDYTAADAEYGPGQYKIVLAPKYGLKMGDDGFSFKTTLKEIAQIEGKTITFMSKLFADASGTGMHYNHSLWSLEYPSKNLFYDSENDNLSDLAKSWIAGLLKHASALSALCAPTLNCYKRVREDSFAPTIASWSMDNRTAAFRPKCRGEKTTYVENRIPAGSANPYIIMAATIAAGLDGIENQLEHIPESQGWIYGQKFVDEQRAELPRNQDQALEALEKDTMFWVTLGDEFVSSFIKIKRYEISLAKESEGDDVLTGDTTEWERYMYLEFL